MKCAPSDAFRSTNSRSPTSTLATNPQVGTDQRRIRYQRWCFACLVVRFPSSSPDFKITRYTTVDFEIRVFCHSLYHRDEQAAISPLLWISYPLRSHCGTASLFVSSCLSCTFIQVEPLSLKSQILTVTDRAVCRPPGKAVICCRCRSTSQHLNRAVSTYQDSIRISRSAGSLSDKCGAAHVPTAVAGSESIVMPRRSSRSYDVLSDGQILQQAG